MRQKYMVVFVLMASVFVSTVMFNGSLEAADPFPEKDVTFMIGYSAGGGNDLITRALIPGMKDLMGVDVVPINLPGASGATCAQKLATEDPAYSIALYSKTLVFLPYTGYGELNIADFTPVAQVAEDTAVLSVASDAPYDTLQDFVAYAKAHPDELRIGNAGTGGLWHLAAVLLAKATDIEVEHVPYKGGNPSLVATASHEVEAAIANPAETRALVDTGDLKVLAIMSDERNPAYPDVPTVKEQGIDFTFPVWRGIFTAAGGPPERIEALAGYISKAMESQDFISFMETSGTPIKFRGPADFGNLVAAEDALYSELLSELGLKVSEPKK